MSDEAKVRCANCGRMNSFKMLTPPAIYGIQCRACVYSITLYDTRRQITVAEAWDTLSEKPDG